jgi:hypothetical protein
MNRARYFRFNTEARQFRRLLPQKLCVKCFW